MAASVFVAGGRGAGVHLGGTGAGGGKSERKKERINYSKRFFFANSALLFLLCTASPTTDFDPISRDSRTSTSPTHRDLRGAEPLELATIERM